MKGDNKEWVQSVTTRESYARIHRLGNNSLMMKREGRRVCTRPQFEGQPAGGSGVKSWKSPARRRASYCPTESILYCTGPNCWMESPIRNILDLTVTILFIFKRDVGKYICTYLEDGMVKRWEEGERSFICCFIPPNDHKSWGWDGLKPAS